MTGLEQIMAFLLGVAVVAITALAYKLHDTKSMEKKNDIMLEQLKGDYGWMCSDGKRRSWKEAVEAQELLNKVKRLRIAPEKANKMLGQLDQQEHISGYHWREEEKSTADALGL